MVNARQLNLFDFDLLNNDFNKQDNDIEKRSGTFIDNMKLPIHRWFRYTAGFSAEWVEKLLEARQDRNTLIVYDPFVGSGTTLIASDKLGIKSIGVEAHPFVARVASAKLSWDSSIPNFIKKADNILKNAMEYKGKKDIKYPSLIVRCFSPETVNKLESLKQAWISLKDKSNETELTWLVLTSIIRSASNVGTAQWQYILPNKEKKNVTEPYEAFMIQAEMMAKDMKKYQNISKKSMAQLIIGDARNTPEIESNSIDIVITSPPYANNYDYADATRLEMTYWGEIESWGDLHKLVRNKLIVSSSQHASLEKLVLEGMLNRHELEPIRSEIAEVCNKLAIERLSHGGKKHYHTMIAGYFIDLSRTFNELRRVCKQNSVICFVIGDSAPYGIYVPVERWLGELAVFWGFKSFRFEKLRDRNIKWKNRKHRVPLQEGRLWIEG